jgi:hypothetical protein
MRVLSGETLSLIADSLERLNRGELDAAGCGKLIGSALAQREAFVELPPAAAAGVSRLGRARENSLETEALSRLNVLLPWTSFNALGNRRLEPLSGDKRNTGSAPARPVSRG